ncbi:MAG TPA: sigma-70 family RNA polymerase sigma factor [Nannocystaceae bacterium]|nr:sigma-70 family RNA polymerase sigma factor [Nannocystaceae bacterium]
MTDVVAQLVGSHRDFLAFLERRVGDRALAEEILQQAFVKGLERADQLRDDESAKAWFYRVLRNAVVDRMRRDGSRGRALQSLADELEGAAIAAPDVVDAVCQCVGRLADTLPDAQAQALRRIELDGVLVKDYAHEAGITANAAGVRVFRARQALREQVMRACGTCAEHGCVDCTCKHH